MAKEEIACFEQFLLLFHVFKSHLLQRLQKISIVGKGYFNSFKFISSNSDIIIEKAQNRIRVWRYDSQDIYVVCIVVHL